ncbi:MAG: SPASM domain-containing protein [Syntrophaceae bacterium]|nr:SPASM domain-containing protein [Syntrophaceae bacterium]
MVREAIDSMLITLDGDIYNCCWETARIGTLRSRSFEEIWNEKLIQDIRQSTLCGIPHRICDNRNSPARFWAEPDRIPVMHTTKFPDGLRALDIQIRKERRV